MFLSINIFLNNKYKHIKYLVLLDLESQFLDFGPTKSIFFLNLLLYFKDALMIEILPNFLPNSLIQ